MSPVAASAAATMARLEEAVRVVRAHTHHVPRLALVLAPAFARVADSVERAARIPADALPSVLPRPESGPLLLGTLEGTAVVAWQATEPDGGEVRARGMPVRLARLLGAERLYATGSAVALTGAADAPLAVVDDHVNLAGANPLVGPNLDSMGPRFPDMSEAYDAALRAGMRRVATGRGLRVGHGVLFGVTDANLVTSAEYSRLRELGADLVGVAAVAEVIVARHTGMRTAALLRVSERRLKDDAADVEARGPDVDVAGAVDALREMVRRLD